MELIICLPTYNEEESIQYMIDELRSNGFNFFVSDAGSTDNTVAIAEKNNVEVFGREGRGKGNGIKSALKIARMRGADYVGFIDCDGTYPSHAFTGMMKMAEGNYDMIIASRQFKDLNLRARVAFIFFNTLLNTLFGSRYKDIHSGMRILKVDRFDGKLLAKNFDTEAEMCAYAALNGYKCGDYDIPYYKRIGKTKVGNIVFFEIAAAVFKYWWKNRVRK
jgi:glycosyltransferase involved in cell wall biosynthesis